MIAPQPIPFDRDAIRAHVEMLHRLADGCDGILPLCVYGENPDSRRKTTIVQHFRIGDVDGMTGAALAYETHPDANVYAPLAVMRRDLQRGEKGSECDVIAVLGAVIDSDADAGKSARPPVNPNYVLRTSSVPAENEQGFIFFDRALSPADAKPIAEALQQASGCDYGTKDLSHVWRVPGTANWPKPKKVRERNRPRDPQPVQVIRPWDGSLTSVDKLRAVLAPHMNGGAKANGHAHFDDAAPGDVAEIMARFGAGLRKLIAAPPIAGEDRSATLASVIVSMIRVGLSDAEIRAVVEAHPNGIGAKFIGRPDLPREIERLRQKFGAAESPPIAPIAATPFVWCDPASIPRREWLYGRFLIRRQVSITVAPGGTGKSSLVAVEALAMATGRALLHDTPHGQLRVWLWNGEDPLDELQRRIAAACLHHDIDADDIAGRLFVDSGRNTEIVIARADPRNGAVVAVPVFDALVETIRANRLDVVMIDPFVSCHAVPENDNGAIDRVAKTYAKIADMTGCAIHLVHHSRKTGGAAVEIEDGRGAVALIAAARAARTLNTMSENEAGKAGVESRFAHVRIDDGKANLAPRSDKARWLKIEAVSLGNSDGGLLDTSDSVAVVTPWEWPDPLDGVTGADFDRVAAVIRAGRWREHIQACDWVGHAVAKALNLNIADKAVKARVAGMVRMWLAAKSLVVIDGFDEKRMPRKFVEVAEDHE